MKFGLPTPTYEGVRGIELWDVKTKSEVQKPFYGHLPKIGYTTSSTFLTQQGRNVLVYATSKGFLVVLREVHLQVVTPTV